MKRTRRKFSADFKAKVVLEALKEQMPIQELSSKFEINQFNFLKLSYVTK
jgi:transposase-like protein